MATKGGTSNVVDSLRQLFSRGDYEAVVQRVEQYFKKRKGGIRSESGKGNWEIMEAINICALIHLGRNTEAAKNFSDLKSSDNADIAHFLSLTAPYLAWTGSGDVSEALNAVKNLEGEKAQKIQAQLLYRLGKYEEASEVYAALLKDAQDTLAEKKKPAATSRWTLRSTSANVPVTSAELETLNQTITELSTNLMATLILSGKSTEAMSKKSGIGSTYEVEYNGACASIGSGDLGLADILLEKAEKLLEADIEEEELAAEEMAPIKVQRAYLKQKSGHVMEAKESYDTIVNNKKADAGCLAVAANNLTVSLGQLAFDKEVQEYEKRKSKLNEDVNGININVNMNGVNNVDSKALEKKNEKEKYFALSEGLKKMRATSGNKVENKLTKEQRRAMARNRSILLVQMGRFDGCKQELDRLKVNYPGDLVNPLIEATLLAKKKNLSAAEEILGDNNDAEIQLARIQLAEDAGDYERTAELLLEFYGDTPAGVATAASIYENDVDSKEKAVETLRNYKGTDKKEEVKKELAGLFGRMDKYKEAAEIWEELLETRRNDPVVLAELIVATSYFDADEAKELAEKLPASWSGTTNDNNNDIETMSGEELEKLAPPKSRRNVNVNAVSTGVSNMKIDDGAIEGDTVVEADKEKKKNIKKKAKKKRLPKNYDPEGPPPDPERWIPKTQRAAYKKKHKRKEGANVNFRGSQGADKKAADEQAIKNKEKAAAKAKAEAEAANTAPVSNRPKGTKAKKKKRK